jgi:uncharacterized protein
MSATHFDPFNNRLARDIRNTLSKSLLQALTDGNRKIYRNCAETILKQDLDPVYEKYVRNRVAKYEQVFIFTEQEKSEDTLHQAAIFWDHGLYFEMHELLEEIWITAEGDKRKALQALIRAAGMKIHAENNNMKAAVSMGTKALAGLEKYHAEIAAFPGYKAVVAAIKNMLAAGLNHSRRG